MEPWLEEQLHFLLTYSDHSEFVSALARTVRDLGFDYFAYGMRASIPITQPEYKLQNNYPLAWQERYESQGYILQDPTVKHAITSSKAIIWNETLFRDTQHFWEDAKSYGLHWGWAQASRLNASTIGMLTLARSSDKLSSEELRAKTPYLLWLNQFSQLKFKQAWLDDMLPYPAKSLSRREIEVAKWCAEGKTSCEIGSILSISERTANFHIANVIQKLNASNKTAAIVRAIQLGII